MPFRCVVSKHLQVLDRDDLLPVCGVSEQYDGNPGERRVDRLLLCVGLFRFGRMAVGVFRFVWLRECESPYLRFFVALCPSIYRF